MGTLGGGRRWPGRISTTFFPSSRSPSSSAHQSGGQARRCPVDAELHHQASRRADGYPALDADHPQRRPDGGRRAAAASDGTASRSSSTHCVIAGSDGGRRCGSVPSRSFEVSTNPSALILHRAVDLTSPRSAPQTARRCGRASPGSGCPPPAPHGRRLRRSRWSAEPVCRCDAV